MKKIPLALRIFAIGFLLNLVWELSQMYFYDIAGLTFWEHLPMCVAATFWDAGIILGIYLLFVTVFSDHLWIQKIDWRRALPILIMGLLIALFIEERALLDGRWNYNELMPIVPFAHAGLLPVVQMMFLPLLTFYLSSKK